MSNFFPIKSDDGSLCLYNCEIKDIYHSKIGAYTEALKKFTEPSGILEFVKDHDEVNILDVCYGLGYNSRVALSEVRKINPKCKVNITALEFDPKILLLSMFNDIKNEKKDDKAILDSAISLLIEDIQDVPKIKAHLEEFKNKGHLDNLECISDDNIHNTYYMSIPLRNNSIKRCSKSSKVLTFLAHIDDLRKTLPNINATYDYIFYDAFSPTKVPEQWTADIFKKIYSLLNSDGIFITYSSANPIRQALIEAKFHIGSTNPIGKRASGTIAAKNKKLIKQNLSNYEKGLLQTRSAISYKDKNFSLSRDEIINNRLIEQTNSNKISTTQFKKLHNE